MNSNEENNIIEIKVKPNNFNAKNIDINDIKRDKKLKTKNIKSKRINTKNSMSNEINPFPSEEQLFKVRNKLNIQDEDKKTIDFFQKSELPEEEDDNKNSNINSNNSKINEIKKEENKGFFGRSLEWVNYIFHEIPLLWKKEELVKGYDANGNIVMRPKVKIPLKNKQFHNIEKKNVENEANMASLDYSTQGLNYGIFFNKTY